MIQPPDNKKKKKDKSGILGLALVLAVTFGGEIVKAISRAFGAGDSSFLPVIIIVAVLVLFAVGASAASAVKKRGTYSDPQAQRAKEVYRQSMKRATHKEKAITCQHTGGNRYVSQLDDFLKNGIIEKEEYNLLKARYEKTDPPDDNH